MAYYKNYPTLFSPGKIGNLTLPNRIILAPMGTSHTGPDHRFSEELIQFYEDRAKGGVGMTISECCALAPEVDPFPMVSITPSLDEPGKIGKIAEHVERVEAYGAVPALQVTLGMGRQADAPHLAQPVSASECAAYSDPSVTCRALTIEEIHKLIECAGRGAAFAMTAGVKLIEIHGHSGYLIDQFLNPEINKRTDEYGGSPENCFRIVKEMVGAIKAVVGDTIPVTLRISVDHKFPGGRTLEEGIEYCKLAEASGIDAVHVDTGRYEVMPWIFPPAYMGPNCMLDVAAAVKKAVNIPVIAVGAIGTPEDAEEAISSGKCDFIAMARSLLADPEWANKAKTGHPEDIRPCLRCNEKCVGRAVIVATGSDVFIPGLPGFVKGDKIGTVREFNEKELDKEDKIVIAGGGVIACETAMGLARNGYKDVTIVEMLPEIGGNVQFINLMAMVGEIMQSGVKVLTETKCVSVEILSISRGRYSEVRERLHTFWRE